MKRISILLFFSFFTPFFAHAQGSDFNMAAQLLSAAKKSNIGQVQSLISSGADINFMDNTGLSIVCTAIMNKDMQAAQILQMYGADASNCDRQIKNYKSKLPQGESTGVLSGLSSPQGIALTAAGAVVVVGGLVFLTDLFGTSNDNGGISSSDDSRAGDGDTTTTTPTAAFTIPFGPAMTSSASETANYTANVNLYSPSAAGILYDNFELMTETYGQNYLLMMGGYSAFGRGYLGMRTLRNTSTRAPISLDGNNLGSDSVSGARPVDVALITDNGIDAAIDTSLEDTLLLWTTTNDNGTTANGASNDMISSKYYNNEITVGSDTETISDDTTDEDSSRLSLFDLADYGTVTKNSFADSLDDLLAKTIGGRTSGYTSADYVGFMPNGQMTIYRTGGGTGMLALDTPVTSSGTYTDSGDTEFGTGDTLVLYSKTLTVTMDSDGYTFSATDGTDTYDGYIGTDGLVYIDSDSDSAIDETYTIETDNSLTLEKQAGTIDYLNYKALVSAGLLWYAGDLDDGLSKPDIVANASVVSGLYARDSKTVSDILSYDSDYQSAAFATFVNDYYDQNLTDGDAGADDMPGTDSVTFFGNLGSTYSPIVIFSTGAAETDSTYSGSTLEASFENSAPLVFDNLEHLFMSVVAVGDTGTTASTSSASGYSVNGKIVLSQWYDTAADAYYKSRTCGVSGTGSGDIDPWCFSAAGVTDELAVASMAGAVGAAKSAFSYMNNKQIFALLALTADGPYLGTTTSGTALTDATLIAYLKDIYQMPNEYKYRWETDGEDYLEVFKEVFGYGLIDLERATTPGKSVYYYNGTDIVSTTGDGYWRSASTTVFNPSTTVSVRTASISAPYYDVLESTDGSLSLSRVWENEFAIDSSASGLYMGDVLDEFNISDEGDKEFKQGNLSVKMGFAENGYTDNMNGLDNLQFGYSLENVELTAGYQSHFTNGTNRFEGTANPVLSLASNAAFSDFKYRAGDNLTFGIRGFSAAITDENLLANDPTVSSGYAPAVLGLMQGAESSMRFGNKKAALTTSVGFAHENDTLLGAQTTGVLALGNGDTTYVDAYFDFGLSDNTNISLRATFAKTQATPTGELIMGLSDIESNSFSAGADFGNFSFTAAMPLTITSGNFDYAAADYEITEDADGNFGLISNVGIQNISLVPVKREFRFTGSYRQKLGEFTDGAVGFIYRINPNNIDDYGDESIFMFKISHKLGI